MTDFVDFKKFFSENLKALSIEKGLDKNDLAQKTDININTFSEYWNGNNLPQLEKALKISDALDVSISYLVGQTKIKESDHIDICEKLKIDDTTINNLNEISKINKRYDNKYSDLLSTVLTNPEFYKILVQHIDTILNKTDSLNTFNSDINEESKYLLKHIKPYNSEMLMDIYIGSKFLDVYNNYIFSKQNLISFGEIQLKEKIQNTKQELKKLELLYKYRYK